MPTRNEEADIAGCIGCIARQQYPLGDIQLIVVDAHSEDRTRDEVLEAAAPFGFGEVLVLDNPALRTSAGLNIGLAEARGILLARVDARSRIPPDYLRACEVTLNARPEIGVVGGAQVARARSLRPVDRGIAAALRNRWATGLSRYRTAAYSGPGDTVWMGCLRTEELRALGGWAEAVALNEDYELNSRYRAGGRVVWFDASLRSDYLPRGSLRGLGRQYFCFGRVKGMWWARGRRPARRQVALVAAPVALLGAVALLVRRLGPLAVVLVPVLLGIVERAGRTERGGENPSATMASASIAVLSASWWVGVVAGFVGELAHVEHEHG
ncbi:MAG: glycosyltransferase [Acidimicrobiales bacterium]